MEIDHIFIFSTAAGHEADELAALGFVEGSSRRHPGQGTTNRKFYCENFFLEILWVVDYAELTSERLRTTQLRQRASFHQTGTSPFGLCLVNTPDTDALFAEAVTYQPAYFPPGKTIEVLPNQHRPGLSDCPLRALKRPLLSPCNIPMASSGSPGPSLRFRVYLRTTPS